MKRGIAIATTVLLVATSGALAAGSAPDIAKTHYERRNCHGAYDRLVEDLDAKSQISAADVAWARSYEDAANAKQPCPTAPDHLLDRAVNRTVVTEGGLGKVNAYLQAGDATARFEAANAVLTGKFTRVEPAVGWGLLKEAADAGEPSALFLLGSAHVAGLFSASKTADYATARPLFERAAATGHVDALFMIANMNKDGIGGKKDAAKAFAFYRQAAERGHTYAAYLAAYMANDGDGVKKDHALAYRLARNLAAQGEVVGAVIAASALLQMKGAKDREDEVLYWMDAAIRDGDARIKGQVSAMRPQVVAAFKRANGPPEYTPRVWKACPMKTVCLVNSSGVRWQCTTNKDYWNDCDG